MKARTLLLTLLFVPGLAADAQNLIVNGGFDADISAWQPTGFSGTDAGWDDEDAAGTPGSGSARVTIDGSVPAGFSTTGMLQCLPVTGGATYELSGDLKTPAAAGSSGLTFLAGDWHGDSACSSLLDSSPAVTGGAPGVWSSQSISITAPAAAVAVAVSLVTSRLSGTEPLESGFDNLSLVADGASACTPDSTSLCLNGDRFRVTASWRRPDGSQGTAAAVPLTEDTGYFWFFNAANVEMIVKVLDNCAGASRRYWVFAAGLTNVEVFLEVEDTRTGDRRLYVNPQRTPFQPIQDTAAFDTCSRN